MCDRYRNPLPPEDVIIKEEDIEVTEEPPEYTIIDGIRCRYAHFIPASFYEHLPTKEEVKAWRIAIEKDVAEQEEIAKMLQESSIKDNDDTHQRPENSEISVKVPSSDLEKKKKTDRTSPTTIVVKKEPVSLSSDESEGEADRQRKRSKNKKPTSKKIKVESSSDECSYEEKRAVQKSGLYRKKNMYSPKRSNEERFPDDYSSGNEREHKNLNLRKKRTRTERYSDEEYEDNWSMKTYGEEQDEYTSSGPGLFYCKECNSSMNSLATYENHLKGKRHLKNAKSEVPSEIALRSIQLNERNRRYPPVTPHCRRVTVSGEASFIQGIVDEFDEPCPGLKNILEIRLPERNECIYYCYICDSPCSLSSILPHLTGFKHQLHCLKMYDPSKYESFRYSKKQDVEKRVKCILKEYEKRNGRGLISVQRDIEVPFTDPAEQAGPSFWHPSAPGERYHHAPIMDTWNPAADIEPDTSKSDFYCPICDAHMNNKNMWEAHVRGKRHQKNLKKRPGELPAKLKYIKCNSSSSKLEHLLRNERQIIIGLNYVRESQGEAGETYTCFLCGACCTSFDIIDHLILPKHRLKYLEKVKADELDTLKNLDIPQTYRDQVIEDLARQYETMHGRGQVEVYVKLKFP